jgi:oxaloacetate decarboxylase alpha subunit
LPKELVTKEEDYISYALFPERALKFFEWRRNPTPEPVPAAPATETKPAPKPETTSDMNVVKELLELASRNDVSELEWEEGDNRVKIRRGGAAGAQPVVVQSQPQPQSAAPAPQRARPRERAESWRSKDRRRE